jgi:carbon storage regulator
MNRHPFSSFNYGWDSFMLIVTLRDGEFLIIADSIKIKVLKTRGADVQLGIDAPQEMKILRNKMLGKKQEEDPLKRPLLRRL